MKKSSHTCTHTHAHAHTHTITVCVYDHRGSVVPPCSNTLLGLRLHRLGAGGSGCGVEVWVGGHGAGGSPHSSSRLQRRSESKQGRVSRLHSGNSCSTHNIFNKSESLCRYYERHRGPFSDPSGDSEPVLPIMHQSSHRRDVIVISINV